MFEQYRNTINANIELVVSMVLIGLLLNVLPETIYKMTLDYLLFMSYAGN